jgi:aminopeptidase N
MNYFVDSDDKTYIYSNLQPFYAHRWFPCFDQPDLKASYDLLVLSLEDWTVISTAPVKSTQKRVSLTQASEFGISEHILDLQQEFGSRPSKVTEFSTSKPISTYVYSLVAGPFAQFQSKTSDIPISLYCRESIKSLLEPLAETWLTTTEKGLKYYEELTGVPY